jgi:hypothetical protein
MGFSNQLPATLAIGFTGHRALGDEARCGKMIFDFLERKKATASGLVYGVSSIAAGADLLFAESCIQLELPLCVLLPLQVEEFRKDFDEASWSRAERVLSRAASVEVSNGNPSRDECYYECGIETVQQSRMLLALWNGEPARGLGGSEDVVAFAKGIGRPVVWLHSKTGEVSAFNEKADAELWEDAELEFLNRLPDASAPAAADQPEALARAWFQKVDECATRTAPQFRRLAAIPIVLTASAALFSGAGTWTHQAASWLTIGAALGIMAGVMPMALGLKRRQARWARTRTAAEICRSVLAFWNTPAPYDAIGAEAVPELSGMLRSLNLLKMLDRGREEASLTEFKLNYRRERVAGQIEYLRNHAAQSASEARRYRVATWASIALAVGLNAWLFFGARLGFAQGEWKQTLALCASIAFQIATVAGALLAVNDCDRRRERYRELHEQLINWDAQLAALRSWPSILRVAGRIEKALLTELIEWRSLIRNHERARRKA